MTAGHMWTSMPSAPGDLGTVNDTMLTETDFTFASGVTGGVTLLLQKIAEDVMQGSAQFAVYSADETTLTAPISPACSDVGGLTTCTINVTIVQGAMYNLRVFADGQNDTGAFWTSTITDVEANTELAIGTLFLPNFNGFVGYGGLLYSASGMQNYPSLEKRSCNGQPFFSVAMTGPTFSVPGSNQTVTPSQATASYYTVVWDPAGYWVMDVGNCTHSEVSACGPSSAGLGCGSAARPYVFMSAGGDTQQTTPAGATLWNTSVINSPPPKARDPEYCE